MIFYLIVWIILTENFNLLHVGAGIIISAGVLLFTRRIFDKQDTGIYAFSFWRLILYYAYLLFLIYKSSFETIIRIIYKLDETCVTKYHSVLKNPFELCLLANAITLTPGTVTLNLQNNVLTILSFTNKDGKSDINTKTLSRIEHILGGKHENI